MALSPWRPRERSRLEVVRTASESVGVRAAPGSPLGVGSFWRGGNWVHMFDQPPTITGGLEMTDTVPHDKSEELSDEVRDARDEAARVAERAKNEAGDGADRAKADAEDVADKVSDAVEDLIPGDSDRDGH
jgi:hypothetical protein